MFGRINWIEKRESSKLAITNNPISAKIREIIVLLSTPFFEKDNAFPKKDQIFPGANLLSSDNPHKKETSLNSMLCPFSSKSFLKTKALPK